MVRLCKSTQLMLVFLMVVILVLNFYLLHINDLPDYITWNIGVYTDDIILCS